MFLRRTARYALVSVVAACLVGLHAAPAVAVPSASEISADRAALTAAVSRYEAAQAASSELDARVAATSAQLDQAIADEQECQRRLSARAVALYRSGELGTLSLLLGAETIQDLAARMDLLQRVARQSADDLVAIKGARAAAERSSEELLALQAEQARALDALADEVASAKRELAASETALREYEAARAAAAKRAAEAAAAARVKSAPDQKETGTGEWQTAVASHYGRNFTGRGASGETIGPYSMIVAHKTLPFGTLIEFEYEGKRAVARVADRGPYTPGRTFDLGPGVVRVLDFSGVHKVRYRIISR